VEPEPLTYGAAHCSAEYHKQGVAILPASREFVLPRFVSIEDNKMKRRGGS
jgi:SH3-like domain-containing protein